MATRSNTLISALASAVKLHPRLSAGLAFELGVMVGSYIRAARGRSRIAGATAKLIEAVPLISPAKSVKPVPRKKARAAVKRRKPARRAA